MKFLFVILAVILAVANAQFGNYRGFDSFGGFGGLNGLSGAVQQRDPRGNTGSQSGSPVLFPPAPADNGMTSGVIVGASGYGFVPPNQPSAKAQALPFF